MGASESELKSHSPEADTQQLMDRTTQPQRISLTLQQPELQPIQQQLLYCLTCPWRPAAAKERSQLQLMAEEKSVSPGAVPSVGMTVSTHLPKGTEMKEVYTLPPEI